MQQFFIYIFDYALIYLLYGFIMRNNKCKKIKKKNVYIWRKAANAQIFKVAQVCVSDLKAKINQIINGVCYLPRISSSSATPLKCSVSYMNLQSQSKSLHYHNDTITFLNKPENEDQIRLYALILLRNRPNNIYSLISHASFIFLCRGYWCIPEPMQCTKRVCQLWPYLYPRWQMVKNRCTRFATSLVGNDIRCPLSGSCTALCHTATGAVKLQHAWPNTVTAVLTQKWKVKIHVCIRHKQKLGLKLCSSPTVLLVSALKKHFLSKKKKALCKQDSVLGLEEIMSQHER